MSAYVSPALVIYMFVQELPFPRTDYDEGYRSGLMKAARLVEERS